MGSFKMDDYALWPQLPVRCISNDTPLLKLIIQEVVLAACHCNTFSELSLHSCLQVTSNGITEHSDYHS